MSNQREIKFRAWDTLTKKMIVQGFSVIGEVTVFGLIDQYIGENMCGKCSLERYNDIIIQQFTGLKDKNGKEIYEGDICQLNYDYFESEGGQIESPIYEIYYKNGCFVFGGELLSEYFKDIRQTKLELEIIGNIFENPNLLK